MAHKTTFRALMHEVSYLRDGARFCNPSRLTIEKLLWGLISSSFFLFFGGVVGVGTGAGCREMDNAPSVLSRLTVFNAAPFNSIGMPFGITVFFSRYAPPAYDNLPTFSRHPSQSSPSKGWSTPPRLILTLDMPDRQRWHYGLFTPRHCDGELLCAGSCLADRERYRPAANPDDK